MSAHAWVQAQVWHDLAFLHWPVAPEILRPLLPLGLALETHGGAAWVGVVPFRMTGVRLRGLPPLPGLSAFPELNVRTYVRAGDGRGVWFFSLDAASSLAVTAARAWYRLPYFRARMACDRDEEDVEVRYSSRRTHRGAPPAELEARYRATGPPTPAREGTLEHFLVERTCLFASGPHGLLRADVRHAPWPLQPGEAEIRRNTMTPLPLAGEPLVHVARRLDVRATAPYPVAGSPAS